MQKFYGCKLWDLNNSEFSSLLTARNISVLPNNIHRCFNEPLLAFVHIKIMSYFHCFNQYMSKTKRYMLHCIARIVSWFSSPWKTIKFCHCH